MLVSAGPDIVTYIGQPTRFSGYALSPTDDIIRYAWDFENDGRVDASSRITGQAVHAYRALGVYTAVLRVETAGDLRGSDRVRVEVRPGSGAPSYAKRPRVPLKDRFVRAVAADAEADGIVSRYAVIINGNGEDRFWTDVTTIYSMLTADYHYAPDHVLVLNYEGTDPSGGNPGNMIDGQAELANVIGQFTTLAGVVNGDDHVTVWVTDHGRGYTGPGHPILTGYLDGFASIDPGDEQDYLERDFKLRAGFVGGDYIGNHGMNVWKVYRSGARLYRIKLVSDFSNVSFENGGVRSDTDVLIERLYDLPRGDTNRNGLIEPSLGETEDYDHDGRPAYSLALGFDEDDWVNIYAYDDDWQSDTWVRAVDQGLGFVRATWFDADHDGCLDLDVNPDLTDFPASLRSDGEDTDNAGLFDGVDLNDDGDQDDWVSVDESIVLATNDLWDDELAQLLHALPAASVSLILEPCFSGGFIEDVSAPGCVIQSATREETESYGNDFIRLVSAAFHGLKIGAAPNADANGNGAVSMLEAFNYASAWDPNPEISWYNDCGDGIGLAYPLPNAGFGAGIYLEDPPPTRTVTPTATPGPTLTPSPTTTLSPTITPTSTKTPSLPDAKDLRVFPQPARARLQVSFVARGQAEVNAVLYTINADAALAFQGTITAVQDRVIFELNTSALAPGIYLLQVSWRDMSGTHAQTRRVAVLR